MVRRVCNKGLAVVLLWLAMATPATGAPLTGDQLLALVDRNLHPTAFEMYARLVNRRPRDEGAPIVIYLAKKGADRAAAVLVAPDDLKGNTALRLGDRVWRHLPGEVAPREDLLSHAWVGGLFTYADLLRFDYSHDFHATITGGDQEVVELTLLPRRPDYPYQKLIMTVDRTHLVPRDIVYYSATGYQLKSTHFSRLRAFLPDAPPRPSLLESASKLNSGYTATLEIGAIHPRELDDQAFTLSFLPTVGQLLKTPGAPTDW